MATYILVASIAAIIQIGTIYFLRANFLGSFLYAVPFILISQFLFLWSYASAPKFLTIWFIVTALTDSLAFLLGYFLWHEQISAVNIVGMVLIVGGVILLQIK